MFRMAQKYVLHGGEPPLPVYEENTGKFLYKALLSRKGNETAFINDTTGDVLTCEELLSNSARLCQSLSIYGVIHDKVIALCSENHINCATIIYGALYAGVPIVLINPTYTTSELQHALNVTKPDMIFCSTPHLEKFLKLKLQNSYIRKIVTIDSKGDANTNQHSFENFTKAYSDGRLTSLSFTTREVDVDNHVAFILFSSGTTGLPKGVMLTHLNINATFTILLGPAFDDNYGIDIFVQVLPTFHLYGLITMIASICRKKKIVTMEKFEPEIYLKCIEKYKIPVLMTVPPLIQFLLKSDVVQKYDLSSVKEIVCGAAPLRKDLREAIKKKFNLKLVRIGYGLTETGLVTLSPFDVDVPGSVGYIGPGASCVVRDLVTGENLGPNQEGELCFKGLTIMKGYYKNDDATKNSFTEDGWFKTGDVGYYDENGYLYFVERLKELIKYKGFQVAPAELEQILVTHPKILDAGVIGIPDERAGELPLAFIVKQPDVVLTETEIHQHMKKCVSYNKQLHGGIIFTDSIPRNPSGKLLRRKLRDLVKNKQSKL